VGGRKGYGQFCPVAKAAEVLGERWALLVVRELLLGSRRFSELRRGLPLISPTVLSQRLRELEEAGIVARGGPRASEYLLTPAGRELGPVVDRLGAWGQRWSIAGLRRHDLDPSYLMWAAYRTVRAGALPPGRFVIAFELMDAPAAKRRWWLVVEDGAVELCLRHPGGASDLTVSARTRALARLWLGQLAPEEAIASRLVVLEGDAALARSFPAWCPRSQLAAP
jgi:DNA-binding HxlR family transcriptional regulator